MNARIYNDKDNRYEFIIIKNRFCETFDWSLIRQVRQLTGSEMNLQNTISDDNMLITNRRYILIAILYCDVPNCTPMSFILMSNEGFCVADSKGSSTSYKKRNLKGIVINSGKLVK